MVYDAFTALVASQAGFESAYVSGAAIAYTRLGRPDIGLVSMTEVAETLALIRDRTEASFQLGRALLRCADHRQPEDQVVVQQRAQQVPLAAHECAVRRPPHGPKTEVHTDAP